MIRDVIQILVNGSSLTREQSASAMNEIMGGEATPAQIGAFLTALRIKRETPEEIAGMAYVMREKSLHVHVEGPMVDTCGTGGDGSHTFNISTTAGFVVAGAGLKVAKHGNRAMSSTCGSADVLEALGVRIDLDPPGVERCIDRVGFGFMFAQKFHPSMKHAAAPRKEIGIRTVFNMLGPLTNPAGVKTQVIGVADARFGESLARVLGLLGSTRAMIVHGEDGLDEITLAGPTRVWELRNGAVFSYHISPIDLGLSATGKETLEVHNAKESADTLRAVLGGAVGPARDVVLANAAAALLVADRVSSLKDGVRLAADSIDSGAATHKLDALISLSKTLG